MNDEQLIEEKQYSFKDITLIKTLLKYLKPYAKWFAMVLLLDVFVDAAFTLEPILTRYMLNYIDETLKLIRSGIVVENPMRMIYIYGFADAMIWILAGLGAYAVNISLKKIGQAMIRDIRIEMFSKVMSLSLSQLRSLKVGSYVTRITNDTQTLSTFFSDLMPQFLRAILTLIYITVTTFVFEGWFGFIFLAFLPIVFLLSYFFRKKAKKHYRANKKAVSKMNSFLSEAFQGIRVTKSFAKENKKQLEFEEKNEAIYNSYRKSQNLFAVFYPMMYLLQMCCVLIILAFGIPLMAGGAMLVGDFNMLYSYSGQFFQPIQTITQLLNQLQSIISSTERILVVLNFEPEIEDGGKDIDVPSFKGKIEFRHVYFAYEKEDYVLKDVSFTIEPGKTIAFVGATGAGKSTIISLISRTYDVNSGEILIDDVPIQDYSISCLRRNIGVMLQEVFLFSGTIADNISLGDEKIDDMKIREGAKKVGADDFIMRLEEGYQSNVSQGGENFSAGQKQLISFARTIVYNPSLVLLDEATANIDTETEHLIQSSIEAMRSIGTMIIVAHRLSTIKGADQIYVMKKGRIIESGTHRDLLQLKGNYYNLYRIQNMERKLDKKEQI